MPIELAGTIYYRTHEVCKLTGISRATLFRWLKKGIVEEVQHKDRRGWRLFTEEDLSRLKDEFNTVKTLPLQPGLNFTKP